MTLKWPAKKDPDEVLDFVIDWTDRLVGDTIATSAWTVPSGITEDSNSETTNKTTIWLSGGSDGEEYTLQNRITTAGGRTHDQSVILRVQTK